MPGVPTKGCYTSQGSMRQGAGSPDSHTRVLGTHMFTHMHSHAHWAVPVTSFLGDSAQLESHTSKSPSAKQQEKRIRGERTVRQAGGPPGEWLQEPEEQLAEGGGGEGSDFLALGWLLGVGRSDYRGAGTQPAGTGIMRCLPKRRHPLEHREAHTIFAWNKACGLLLPWRRQPGPLSLTMWVAGPTRLGGSKDPHQASRLGRNSNIRFGDPKASLQAWSTTPLGLDVFSSPCPSPTL